MSNTVNLKDLKKQKQWLVSKYWETRKDEPAHDIAWGIIHLLDYIQDELDDHGKAVLAKDQPNPPTCSPVHPPI